MRVRYSITFLLMVGLLSLLTTGCKKKAAVAPPPPVPVREVAPPPPSAPTASLNAEPTAVEPGQTVTLKWSSENATEAAISGLGTVGVEGSQEVRPATSTTYEFVATGPGGSAKASATVIVTAPLPVIAPPPPAEPPSLEARLAEVSDAFFDYDRSEIREDARAALEKDAEALRSILVDFPAAVVALEGYCDERGSAEYNLGLGDKRVNSVSAYLAALGVQTDRLQIISYGKDKPQCVESTEECWQKNRRVHFATGVSGTN